MLSMRPFLLTSDLLHNKYNGTAFLLKKLISVFKAKTIFDLSSDFLMLHLKELAVLKQDSSNTLEEI